MNMQTQKEDLPKGFYCKTCGEYHWFQVYVTENRRVILAHKCHTGSEYEIVMGQAKLVKAGNAK